MRRVRGLLIASVAAILGGSGYVVAGPAAASRTPTPLRQRTFARCPPRDLQSPLSLAPGSRTAMVPGRPKRLMLCRYSGFGAYPNPLGAWAFHLGAHRLITAEAIVAQVATELNVLKPVSGIQSCPVDTGEALLAVFQYRSASAIDDPVVVHLGGCEAVDNGHVFREASQTLTHTLLTVIANTRPRSEPYRLYTHCGIEWTRIRGTYWHAGRPLSDGQGNPPSGWGNPYQHGTLTFTGPRTAVFRAPPGRVTFHRTNLTRSPLTCS